MATGLFLTGYTVDEVLALHAKAKALIGEGKTLMSYGEAGSTGTKQFTMPPKELLEECNHALRVMLPEVYGRQRKVAVSSSFDYLAK